MRLVRKQSTRFASGQGVFGRREVGWVLVSSLSWAQLLSGESISLSGLASELQSEIEIVVQTKGVVCVIWQNLGWMNDGQVLGEY